jgi:hypothetical protein
MINTMLLKCLRTRALIQSIHDKYNVIEVS